MRAPPAARLLPPADAPPPRTPPPATPKMPRRAWLLFLGVVVVNVLLIQYCVPKAEATALPWSRFRQEVANGAVASIEARGDIGFLA